MREHQEATQPIQTGQTLEQSSRDYNNAQIPRPYARDRPPEIVLMKSNIPKRLPEHSEENRGAEQRVSASWGKR